MMEAEFIRVTARVRPAATKEERIVNVHDDRNLCFNPKNPKYFTFDYVFGENVTQDLASRIIDGCVDGYNGTVFAYGQTGSGKTHTMFGPPNVENSLLDCHQRGLMPRACEALFKKLCTRAAERGENFTYEVFCRFVELYNEEFYDLLSSPQQKLSIRSDSKGVQLLGVSEHRVQSSVDMMRILEIGCDARRTAETAMNRESSRSHSIFIVDVKTEELVNTIVNKKCATLNLVDLAGSERQVQSKVFGDRFKEAISINLSLTVLGRVIRTLSDINRRDEHIPYRDSKLTHILRDSLGGNSRTAVIVNVHPEKGYYSDTLSTLQFAAACRKIENRVRANEDLAGGTIMAYKAEIAHLREELRSIEEKTRSELKSKVSAIESELRNWKDTAISREKALVKAQIQRDLLHAELATKTNQESSTQSHYEVMRDVLSQLWKRIDSVNTLEDLTKVQLENDLASARSELSQLWHRYEFAEAARKALNEKYNDVLEECNETFLGTPLRRLNLNTTLDENQKTLERRKKLRRRTMFAPVPDNRDRTPRAFKPPILFEEEEHGESAPQGAVEEDKDVEERELLRLEIENNRLSQIILEKEAAIKDICDKQKNQSKQWIEEKKLFIETESSLNARIEDLRTEKCSLLEDMNELQQRTELLSAKLSLCNDEKCRLEQSLESIRSEKLDLEDRLQAVQNENERLLLDLGGVTKLETSISELQSQLSASHENNRNIQIRNETLEKECHSHLMALRSREDEVHRAVASLHKIEEEKKEVLQHYENLKKEHTELQEILAKLKVEMEEEVKKLKRRHVDELNSKENAIELKQNDLERTREQFVSYRENIQETFNRKLAELRETFSNKERRLIMDLTERDQQIIQLHAEREQLLRKCGVLEEARQEAENNKVELEETMRELTLLREEKSEVDRALTELVGHNNHKQKVNYLDKIRYENHMLRKRNNDLEALLKRYRDPVENTKPGATTSGIVTRSRAQSGTK
ncbi:hypothetical protein Angca_008846 [Angiostrongylus cantonensis]|nr:hypothetical protein Angca_008846 [Angiostrongylus cantonensis]